MKNSREYVQDFDRAFGPFTEQQCAFLDDLFTQCQVDTLRLLKNNPNVDDLIAMAKGEMV